MRDQSAIDPTNAIEIKGLNNWYDKLHALKDVDLSVVHGERAEPCRCQRACHEISGAGANSRAG